MSDETKPDEPKKALPPMTPDQLAALQHILTDLKTAFPLKWVLALVLSVIATAGAVKIIQPSPAQPDQWEQAMLDGQTKMQASLDAISKKLDTQPIPPIGPNPPAPDSGIALTVTQSATNPSVYNVKAATKLKEIVWVPPGEGDWHSDGFSALFVLPANGSGVYIVEALGVVNGKPVWAREKIVQQAPQPPPTPVDAFQKAIQDAYVADGKPANAVANLADLYKKSGTIVNNASLTKFKDILDTMHSAAQIALGEPDQTKVTILPNVRRLIANEFNSVIAGKTGTALTDNDRKTIAAEFLKAQHALEGVK